MYQQADTSYTTTTFYSTSYGQSQRHWFSVSGGKQGQLPGRVCSAVCMTLQGRRYALVSFCNSTFLSFLDLSLVSVLPRLLIGGNSSGYQEGFKDQARFGSVLHLALEGQGPSFYVSDTLNCALRMVSIPTVPGDFLTRSYWVYGASAGTCKTTSGAILNPGRLFPLLGGTRFLFPATGGLYQLDSPTRGVVMAMSSSGAPASIPDLSLVLAAELGDNGANTAELTLSFASVAAVLTPITTHCDPGFTSLSGGACTQPCSKDTNYVDPMSGACLACFTRACLPGEQLVPCTPSSPQTCVPCPGLTPAQGKYPLIYSLPGSCAASNTLYTTFCPQGKYLSSTVVSGQTVCADCPLLSTTSADGATSIEQCRCFDGTTRVASGQCVVGQLYPQPILSRCPFGQYHRGGNEVCSSCRLDPFPQCDVGKYPLGNASCVACQVPANSVALSAGIAVNAPLSCGFVCLPGYFPKSGTSYQSRCQPCTNAPTVGTTGAQYFALTNGQQDTPAGCTWGCSFPFTNYNGQCVPCQLRNRLRAGDPCTLPGLTVNSSAGNGTQGGLAGVTYRMIQFNASGFITFSRTTTVDLLVVGGGGAGGAAPNRGGAGGGGGAGQVLLAYGVSMLANQVYPVIVGDGGTWTSGAGTAAKSSSVAGFQALYGGNGGGGLGNDGARGAIGASGGGTGSSGTDSLTVGGGTLLSNGFMGGGTTGAFMAGGGGGSGCTGEVSQQCLFAASTGGNGDHSGAGGCGTVFWANTSTTFFFPWGSPALAGGGGGGSSWPLCPVGAAGVGGTTGGQDALPNTGAGGGGACPMTKFSEPGTPLNSIQPRFMPGGAGGSGVVVVRYVDEPCVCGN